MCLESSPRWVGEGYRNGVGEFASVCVCGGGGVKDWRMQRKLGVSVGKTQVGYRLIHSYIYIGTAKKDHC